MSWLPVPCQSIFLCVMPYFCVSCHIINIPCHAVSRFLILAPTNMFLLGGFQLHRPPALPGGHPAPQTPWQGACSPLCPPFIPRGSASRALLFFGTKILGYQNLGSGSWCQVVCRVPNVACHAVSIPFVSKSAVSCRVINLRVGVSVPCRGHPDGLSRSQIL